MKKIWLLDGAFGTEIWKLAEERGLKKVSTFRYCIEHPELVEQIHADYSRAGAEIIYTNTFTANRPAAEAEGFDPAEVINAAVKLAKKGAQLGAKQAVSDELAERRAASKSDRISGGMPAPKPRRIAMDIGPLFQALEPFGDVTEDQCRAIYREMCQAGASAGADLIVLETFMDAEMLRIAAEEAKKTGLPVFCTMSFHNGSRTFYGAGIDDMLSALMPLKVDAVGLNCSFGPEKAVPVIREFAEKTDLPLILKPNTADLSPEDFAKAIEPALSCVSYLGSCCGSDPQYTNALKKLIANSL